MTTTPLTQQEEGHPCTNTKPLQSNRRHVISWRRRLNTHVNTHKTPHPTPTKQHTYANVQPILRKPKEVRSAMSFHLMHPSLFSPEPFLHQSQFITSTPRPYTTIPSKTRFSSWAPSQTWLYLLSKNSPQAQSIRCYTWYCNATQADYKQHQHVHDSCSALSTALHFNRSTQHMSGETNTELDEIDSLVQET